MTEKTLLPVTQLPLPGGSMLYCLETPGTPLAILQAVVRTGSIHEGADAGCGVSHFLEHMLFQGSARYPAGAVGKRVHALGGDCNAYTSFDHTAYYIELPAEHIAEAADMLASMVAGPLFPEDKFESEKTVIAREAQMIADRPEQKLVQNLWSQVYLAHPARFPIVGYPDKIAGVDRERMIGYYRRRYGASRCYWIASGAVHAEELQKLLAEKLSGFQRGNLDEPVIPAESVQQFERRTADTFADPLARIALGIRTPEASDDVIPALDVLTGILGQNDSSRLVRQLWQERELAVNVSSVGFAAGFGGVVGVSAACVPEKLSALEAGIREILADVREHGITEAELAREKIQQRVHVYRSLECVHEKLNLVNDGILNFGTPDFAERYLAKLDALSLDEVNQAAHDYLAPHRFAWSVLTPETTPERTVPAARPARPEILTGKTACGAEYAVLQRGAVPMEALSALLPAGPVWEAGEPGPVSSMLSEMLSTGSSEWSESEFYDLLDRHGMDWDVSLGRNTLSLELTFPAEFRALAEKVFTSLLRSPRWERSVFSREKRNLAEQLASRMMKPQTAALMAARSALYGMHPAGRDQLGTPHALQRVTLAQVQAFYASRFDPAQVKFGGTAETPESMKKLAAFFDRLAKKLPWRKEPLTVPVEPEAQPDGPVIKRLNIPRGQSAVIAAIRSCPASAPEHVVIDILDQALNGMSSHLFDEVREKRSLAYTTGAALNYGLLPGVIALYAGVDPKGEEPAAQCLLAEIERLGKHGLDKAEFEAARRGAVSASARRMEESSTRLLSVLLALFYHEPPEYGLTAPERLARLRYAESNRMLKKIFNASRPVTVIAGDPAPENGGKRKTKRKQS